VLKISIVYPVLTVACIRPRVQGRIGVDVTRTSTIFELANRVFCIGIFVPFVRTRLVVALMATGASGCQRRRRGIRNGLAIVLVTRYTTYGRIMVAWVVNAPMREINWRPALCGMTYVAILHGGKMVSLWGW